MEGLGKAIGCLFTIAIIGLIGIMGSGLYLSYDYFREDTIESPKRITPEIKLTTDGKKVDTLFIYKINK